MINESMPKTSLPEVYKTFEQKKVWKIPCRDVVPIMEDKVDTEKTKSSP